MSGYGMGLVSIDNASEIQLMLLNRVNEANNTAREV
jgi:hypothetical protein